MKQPSSGTRKLKIALLVIAVISIGVAVSYPILDKQAQLSNEGEISELSALRRQRLEEIDSETAQPAAPEATPKATAAPVTAAAGTVTAAPAPETEPSAAIETAVPTPSVAATVTVNAGQTATTSPTATVKTTVAASPTDTVKATAAASPTAAAKPTATVHQATAIPTATPDIMVLILDPPFTPPPMVTPSPRPTYTAAPAPTATPDRFARTGASSYDSLEKVVFDEGKILPELREIYEINHDLIGWLTIPDTSVDYPVVQTQDSAFYLGHDFYGKENINGQIILDSKCDPFTPSYNLVISGHRMNSGAMFGNLSAYAKQDYWAEHKTIEFDTLMQRRTYVIFGVFYSADYDEHEEGFRYNADIRYKIDAENWLSEVAESAIYDTGVDAQFGDEFLTLTTCVKGSYNGRFVVVARKIREGETIE